MSFDVVIVGGGPAGLAAALTLGRACKRVLLCDAGPPRNAAAQHVHNFLTRDGTPPPELRAIGRQQLATYPQVVVREARVASITGARGAFEIGLAGERFAARRVLLCTGMIDEPPALGGLVALWGHGVFQCPYCHGWELRDRPWGHLAHDAEALHFSRMLLGWTREVTVFTGGAFGVPDAERAQLAAAGLRVEASPIARLVAAGEHLVGVALADGRTIACEALFVHPPQRQVALVGALGLALDEAGFVRVDPMTRETSVPGVYAAGDLTTRMQAAIAAAAAGMQAAAALNHALTLELTR